MARKDPLAWLLDWYLAQCDGDWEHDCGVKVETLDNPGWSLTIDLRDTELEDQAFARVEHGQPSENLEAWRGLGSWWVCEVKDRRFQAHCGPLDLAVVIDLFRSWAGAD